MATSLADLHEHRVLRTLVIGLGLYFAAQVLIRVVTSAALEMDEAEQVFLTQWFLFGYSPKPPLNPKPPLYTWLQLAFFQIFGVSVFALSFLKNLLLFLTFVFVFLSARLLTGNVRLAVLTTLSLFLFPQIAWESQRDLTHSVLAMMLGAATLLGALYVSRARTLSSYILFGGLLGLGTMSKYTFLIFASALLLGLLLTPDTRAMILDRRILATLAVSVLVTLPHLLWWWSHVQEASSYIGRLPQAGDTTRLQAVGAFLRAIASFLAIPCLAYVLLFPSGFRPSRWVRATRGQLGLLDRVLVLVLAIFGAIAVLLVLGRVNQRWLQPLLWFFPIAFFAHLPPEAVSERAWRWCVRGAVAVAAIILVASPVRVVGLSLIDRYTPFAETAEYRFFRYPARFNYPFEAIAEEVRKHGFDKGVIVAETGVLAGNMRLQFPDSLVAAPRRMPVDVRDEVLGKPVVAIWDASRVEQMPDQIRRFLDGTIHVEPGGELVIYREYPYKYSAARVARIGLVFLGGKELDVDKGR